jgi:hypothetical protein
VGASNINQSPMFHCVFSNIYTTFDPNGKGFIHGADLFHDIVLEQIEGSGIGTSNLFDGHFQPKFQGWRVNHYQSENQDHLGNHDENGNHHHFRVKLIFGPISVNITNFNEPE